MTREHAKQLLPIIQAFAEGEEIEYLNTEGKWTTADYPGFSSDPERYRIKPKPREFKLHIKRNINLTYITVEQLPGAFYRDDKVIHVREILD